MQPQGILYFNQLLVEFRPATEGVVEASAPLHDFGKAGQKRPAVRRFVGFIGRLGTFNTRPVTGPDLGRWIPGLDKEGIGRSPGKGGKDGRGVGVFEARQVPEIAVLAKAVAGVVGSLHDSGAGNDGDGVGPHGVE